MELPVVVRDLERVARDDGGGRLWLDVGVLGGCVALVLGATTLRRRTP